jgi:hypothetical protein
MDVCVDTPSVIAALEESIKTELEENPDRCNSIFRKFNPGPENPILYKGNKHCEMILAVLLKYPNLWADNKELLECLKVWLHFQYHSVCQPDALHRM